MRETGFAHIAQQLTQNNDKLVIEPRKMHVKKPAMPVAHTGYEIEDSAASLQALFKEEPEVIQLSPEQQKEAALQAAKKQENEKKEFEQLLASLAKDVNKEGRSLQQMNITMQWIDKYMGQLTRSDLLTQEDKERILGEFNVIKEQLTQKITAATLKK